MKFTFTSVSEYSGTKTTVEFEAETLGEIVEHFEAFLKGGGFHFNGYLDLTEDEPNTLELVDENPEESV